MYKIVISNLGYENENVHTLDNKVGDLEKLLKAIKRIVGDKRIVGYKIINVNFDITEKDFNNEYSINVVETEDVDRCISIVKVE